MERERIAVVIGALVAVVLQIVLAPNIALFGALPNFMLAYTIAIAIARPYAGASALAFTMGILYNLIAGGAVGSMAILLVLVAFLASRAFSVLDNDTLFMPLVIVVVSTVAIEFLYAIFAVGIGANVGIGHALLYRALPCALYDVVLSLVMYPIATRFIVVPVQSGTPLETPNLR